MSKSDNPLNTVKVAHLSVLVVDDDKMVRDIIVQHLKAMGFTRFLEAGDGSEALKILVDSTSRVDLILCDWEMPRTDGLSFLRAVRANRFRSETPFIMVTSQQSQERMKVSKAKKNLVNAYIVKPFRAETLRQKIFQVLFGAPETKSQAS
jgi:two-component system, chemotaxis family, chemotaxis protein CheY